MKTICIHSPLIKAFTFVLIFASLSASGQQFIVKQSAAYDYEDHPNNFVSYRDNLYAAEITDKRRQLAYTAKLDKLKFGIRLHKFTGNFTPVKEVKLFNGERKFGPLDPKLRIIGNQPCLLYYRFADNGEESNFSMMAASIDTSSLELKAEKELFSVEMKNIGVFQMINLITQNSLEIKYSPDSTKVAFVWATGINQDIYVTVTNRNLEKIWSKKETFTHPKKFNMMSAAIDNSGMVYVTFKMEVKRELETFLAVIQQNKSLVEKDLQLTGAYSYEAHLLPANDGKNIVIAGTYGMSEESALTGLYLAPVSPMNFNIGKETLTPFTESLVQQLDKEGWASTKKKKYGIERLDMVPTVLKDGSFSLTGHFTRTVVTEKNAYGNSGPILVAHMGNNKPAVAIIPKARVSAGSRIGDFIFPFANGNQTVVLYNDSEKNFNKALDEESSRADVYKNFIMVAAVVNPDGSAKKYKVLDLSSEDYLSQPEVARLNPDGSVLIPFRKIKGMGGLADKLKFVNVQVN